MMIFLLIAGVVAYLWSLRQRSRGAAALAAALGVAWLARELLTLRTDLDRPDAALVVLAVVSQTAVAAFLLVYGLRLVARPTVTRR